MVLDNLDKAIEEGWERPTSRCSYSNYLGYYVNYKIILHHLMSANERGDMRKGALFFDQRRHELMTNMERTHSLMYSSPCLVCRTCLLRKKPWPKPKRPTFDKYALPQEGSWSSRYLIFGEKDASAVRSRS